jgi:GNAT superfamily N-acetyltransferase
VRTVGADDLRTYTEVEPGGATDIELRSAIARRALADPRCRLLAGRVDGRPGGRAMAVATPPVLGIYNVHTALAARRRGVASALTVAALEFGREAGCSHAFLAATPAGRVVYMGLGFEEVDAYLSLEGPSLRS